MKRIIFIITVLTLFSCNKRIADLTVAATRNVDSNVEYQELKRYQLGKDVALNRLFLVGPLFAPNIEEAIDDAVKKVEGGEYMRNVVIKERNWFFILFSLRTFRVEGDVWGVPPESDTLQ